MDPGPSLLPLEARLRTLEAQIVGAPAAYAESSSRAAALSAQNRSVFRRVREIQDALDRAGHESEAVRRLINGYASYAPLLSLDNASTRTGESDPTHAGQTGNTGAAEHDPRPVLSPADLLPDMTKVTMLLEAAHDIKAAERDLREIQLLRDREVEGSGMLEELLPLKHNLVAGIQEHRTRSKELAGARKQVSSLLRQYTEYTNTVSELFLDVHRRLENMEDAVSRAERRRKKEAAERY